MRILLTGATGYVGGRLLKALQQSNHELRCLARKPESLARRAGTCTSVVRGDALDYGTLAAALVDIDVAYYLVHSMGSAGNFEEDDRTAASNFGRACAASRVRKIIYLGGLGPDEGQLSSHLRSRHEVGSILREYNIPLIEFRASVIIGSGSISFELVRALTERLPVMIAPRWVSVPAQPIAIDDVTAYLIAAAKFETDESRVFEIGGADVVSYGGIIKEYARQRGLRRIIIPVPVLTPYLSSLWLGLVTPVYARIGRKLIEGLRYPTTVRNASALEAFGIRPRGIREAMSTALEETR